LEEDKKYTFSGYFYFPNPTEGIANYFGYSLTTKILNLPASTEIGYQLKPGHLALPAD